MTGTVLCDLPSHQGHHTGASSFSDGLEVERQSARAVGRVVPADPDKSVRFFVEHVLVVFTYLCAPKERGWVRAKVRGQARVFLALEG